MGASEWMGKTILQWKSKVQYKKNTPYIYFIRHLSQNPKLRKGNEVDCRLILKDDKLKVVVDLD